MSASRNRAGTSISVNYDNLDRPTSETDPGVSTPITFTYDPVGRPVTVADVSGTFSYLYDTAGRQKQTTRLDGLVLKYQYDVLGRTSLITYPDGVYSVGYTYDEIGRMLQVQESNPQITAFPIATYSYDALSRRTNLAYGNRTSASYGYDQLNGLTSLAQTFQAPSPGVTFSYGRDALERNSGETVNQTGYLWHPPGAGTTSYTTGNLNQYRTINGNTLGYDANGNLGSDPTAPLGTATYGWDLKNRLISAKM